jgi:hypothetical protein
VHPVPGPASIAIDQPEEDLMDEFGRLERMPGAFAPHFALGHLPELGVQEPEELLRIGG